MVSNCNKPILFFRRVDKLWCACSTILSNCSPFLCQYIAWQSSWMGSKMAKSAWPEELAKFGLIIKSPCASTKSNTVKLLHCFWNTWKSNSCEIICTVYPMKYECDVIVVYIPWNMDMISLWSISHEILTVGFFVEYMLILWNMEMILLWSISHEIWKWFYCGVYLMKYEHDFIVEYISQNMNMILL